MAALAQGDHTGESMHRCLRAANVTCYRLRLDDVVEMNFTAEEIVTYALREGDILREVLREYVG